MGRRGSLKAGIQKKYETWLGGFARLIHGNTPAGLAAKLATYTELIRQSEIYGDDLWRIEPLLPTLIQALEIDLHFALAKLLEAAGRSDRSMFAFLKFCRNNQSLITWRSGSLSDHALEKQQNDLAAHTTTIDTLMKRRDKFFAHMDKAYFLEPARIYADFPLEASDVIAVANTMISIVASHERRLTGAASFHMGEFYTISVDNMVRNLRTGRSINFPGHVESH